MAAWIGSVGSSPRVRGSRHPAGRKPAGAGFIPARAGEPGDALPRPRRATVHPRACGGAGDALPRPRRATVHPRACGGARVDAYVRPFEVGSSPRVRGSRVGELADEVDEGFIPARAGEPRSASTSGSRSTVHPRACGGARSAGHSSGSPPGSSPRVRGSLELRPFDGPRDGFIPARAGEPRGTRRRSRSRRVHPRACGGAVMWMKGRGPWRGSSPRVRGSHPLPQVGRALLGFIPARAGEPPAEPASAASPRVHPRACGGACTCPTMLSLSSGSSPRVRGSRRQGERARAVGGVIPARAGEPLPPRR